MSGPLTFEQVEAKLRRMTFGILGTVTPHGRSHSSGVVYGLSPLKLTFALYVLTRPRTRKARNVRTNPNVSFAVPFPHHFLRFVPSSCVQFQGTAKILTPDHEEGVRAFTSSRILKMSLKEVQEMGKDEAIFIRILPCDVLHIYGLGFGIMQMRKDITVVSYKVEIPEKRRVHPGRSSPPKGETR